MLDRLEQAIRQNRPGKRVIYLHDNARPHTSREVQNHIERKGWDLMPHPAYSPDLNPCDFKFFRTLQHHLNAYPTREALENAVIQYTEAVLLAIMFVRWPTYHSAGYINGITSRLGAYAGYFQFEIIIFIYAHTIFNLASCLMYRVTQALPPTDGYFFAEKRNSLIFMAIIYVTLVIPPCVLMPMSRINLEIVQEKLRKDVFNITEEFIKSNAIFGYDPSENPIFYIALSSIAISLLGFIILSSGLAAQLYFAIKKIGPLLSPETRHMQMMLYKLVVFTEYYCCLDAKRPQSVLLH
uniref:Tc1-like transposase DDE domain-containing protein n=1 Tax=Acrobeloides nanus TaxID=290746 RepID=A0A914D820_9BILA